MPFLRFWFQLRYLVPFNVLCFCVSKVKSSWALQCHSKTVKSSLWHLVISRLSSLCRSLDVLYQRTFSFLLNLNCIELIDFIDFLFVLQTWHSIGIPCQPLKKSGFDVNLELVCQAHAHQDVVTRLDASKRRGAVHVRYCQPETILKQLKKNIFFTLYHNLRWNKFFLKFQNHTFFLFITTFLE